MLRATLRNLIAHKLRLLLTALSVVIGVGFVSGTMVFTDTLNNTFEDLVGRTSQDLSVVVRSHTDVDLGSFGGASRAPIPETVLDNVKSVDGVKQAEGSVEGSAVLVTSDGRAIVPKAPGPPTLGVSWSPGEFGALDFVKGAGPHGPGEVAIDQAAADRFGIHVGDTVTVQSKEAPRTAKVTGIVTVGGSSNLAGAVLAVFDLQTAQKTIGKVGYLSQIDVAGQPGVSQTDLASRVSKVLPEGLEAVTAKTYEDEQRKSFSDLTSFFGTFLLVFAGVALFVGSFIILNTFTMLVAQRTRELALLRVVGASRRQVTRSVLGEALAVGVIASTLGLGFGFVVALGLRGLLGALGIGLPNSPLVFLPHTAIWAYVIGILVTVIAAYFPARRAAKVPPVAALRDDVALPVRSLRIRAIVGAVLTVAGVLFLITGLSASKNGLQMVGLGVALVFIGVAALSPFVAQPVIRVLGAPFVRFGGAASRLARINAIRNPRRTASTAAALTIGVTLVAAISVLATSAKASIGSLIDANLGADYVLTSSGSFEGFTPDVAQRAREADHVRAVVQQRFGQAKIEGKTAALTGLSTDADQVMKFSMTAGSYDALDRGELLISEKQADDHHWKVGDSVAAKFVAAPAHTFTVGGIFEQAQLTGDYVVSLDTFAKYFSDANDQFVYVLADEGQRDAAYDSLTAALKAYPQVSVSGQADFKDQISGQVDQMLGLMWGLLALALVIAVLGIVNTLALSVHERRREVGLLRAVGMRRAQVSRMVSVESVVIAVFGALLGLVLGTAFGAVLVTGIDDLTVMRIPGGWLVGFVVAAGVVGWLAAIWPGRKAARLDILDAIATD